MVIHKNQKVQWIDVERPSNKDLASLEKKFNLHPVIADELRGPSARARVEQYDGYLFFVYYFPKYETKDETSVRTEIDFVISKNAVATVHYEPLSEALRTFKIKNEKSSLDLMYNIIEHLITFEERQLRHIRDKVEDVSREIFKDKERQILERITYLKRDVSEFRIVVRLQEPIFRSLVSRGQQFWGKDAEIYLSDLAGSHLRVVNQLEDYREAISDFEDTNNQMMNLKINSVMKTFTALSFLTFPFVLIAALFSMRVPGVPFMNHPYGFWIVVGIMIFGMAALTVYFKNKRWF